MSTPFTPPPRPKPLPISKTAFYKTVGKTSIPVDIYLPTVQDDFQTPHPIVLYIHGGGWAGGNRGDYSRPLFQRFLLQNYIVCSMDYRLLPETSFEGQLEDVKDIEPWLRSSLQDELKGVGLKAGIDGEKIVVVGASAGALLALLTPKLWSRRPTALLSLYGPTSLQNTPYLSRGRLSTLNLPACTPTLLSSATDFTNPPTEQPLPTTAEDYSKPRYIMTLSVFRNGLIPDFLPRGLVRGEDGIPLSLPRKGCVSMSEIVEINPLDLCKKFGYPPTYQIIGTDDEIFETSQATGFDAALKKQGVESVAIVVPDVGHAFDIWATFGGGVDVEILSPAVSWLAGYAAYVEIVDPNGGGISGRFVNGTRRIRG